MKKTIFLIAIVLSMIPGVYAQVQIGTGDNINSSLPFEPSNPYSYSQSIYLANEIDANGPITSLQWKFTGITELENSQDIQIYFGHTVKNQFDFQGDWIAYDDLTLVYSGGIELTESGWVLFDLITPFNYNGTDNLVIAVKENHSGFDSYMDGFHSTLFDGTRSIIASTWMEESNPDPVNPPTTEYGYIQSYVPNVILGGITQACPTVFYLTSTEITTTSANISWEEQVVIPEIGIEYYISNENVPPIGSTQPTGSSESGDHVIIEDLEPGSSYYVWIRNICGTDLRSAWSAGHRFYTLCLPITSIDENFDSIVLPELPLCWSTIIQGDQYATVETVNMGDLAASPPYQVRLKNGNIYSESDNIMLISPELSNLNSGTHRLRFNAKATGGGGAPVHLEILTLNSNEPEGEASLFETIETEVSFFGTDYVVDFSGYDGEDSYIGFRLKAISWGSEIYLDDIKWEIVPPCDDVNLTSIFVPEVGSNSVKIEWSEDDLSAWQVVKAESSVMDPNEITPILTTSIPEIILEELQPDTEYKVWIRSSCHLGEGVWIGPVTFKTNCLPITEFSENFDNTESTMMPDCWTKIINPSSIGMGAPSVYVYEYPFVSHSEPNAVMMYTGFDGLTTNNNDVILVSPPLSNIGDGTHRLKLHAFSGSVNAEMQVVILDSNTIYSDYTVVATFVPTSTNTEYIFNFDEVEGNTENFIGIRMNSTSTSGSSTVYIDDVIWELAPPCPNIPYASVNVDWALTTEAKITWSPGGLETEWQIALGSLEDTDPELLTPFITATDYDADTMLANKIVTGLEASSTYQFWLRSICDEGEGEWIGPFEFKTSCLPVSSVNENFDDLPQHVLPDCWSRILRGPTLSSIVALETIAGGHYSAPHSMGIYKGTSEPTDDLILVLPEVDNLDSGTYRLTFRGIVFNFAGGVEVGTLNNNTNEAVFTYYDEAVFTNTNEYYEFDFSGYEGTDTFIGIRLKSDFQHTAVYLDNIVWEPIPACSHISEIEVYAITDDSVQVEWTPGEIETGWQVAYAVATEENPDDISNPYVEVEDFAGTTLNGLLAGTTYNLWVRSVCSNGFGFWSLVKTFTTDCAPVDAFNENFDTITTPDMPSCWTFIKRGNTVSSMAFIGTAALGTQSAPNSFNIYKGDSSVDDDFILVSPNLSNLSSGTHFLKFYAMIQNTAGELEIGTLNTNDNEAEFTLVNSITPTTSYQEYTVNFDGISTTDKYIGIRLNSTGMHTVVYIDNVVWSQSLGQENFDFNSLQVYPNPVSDVLNISFDKNIESIAIYNMLGQLIYNQNTSGNTVKIDVSAFAVGNYLVKINSESQTSTFKIMKQ